MSRANKTVMLNMSLDSWVALIQGIIAAAEWALAMWNDIMAVHASGAAPTDAQWAEWDAAALAAHNAIQDTSFTSGAG